MMSALYYLDQHTQLDAQCQLTETTIPGQTCRSIRTYPERTSLFSLILCLAEKKQIQLQQSLIRLHEHANHYTTNSVITSCLGDLHNNGLKPNTISTIRTIIFTLYIIQTCIYLRNFISNVYFTILILKSKNRILYYRFGTTVPCPYIFQQSIISCFVTYKLAFCNEIQALQAQ